MNDLHGIVRQVAWDDPAAVSLRRSQRDELEVRYGTPDSEPGPAPTALDMTVFFVAFSDDDEPLGCGGLRELDATHGEIKRMFVSPSRRGTGTSTAILGALEQFGRARAWTRLVLETGAAQPDAMRFYEREGFIRIPPFGYYIGSTLSVCYGKEL